MMNRILIRGLMGLQSRSFNHSFQLCSKQLSRSYFSHSKKTIPPNPQNQNPSPQQPQPQGKAKSSRQRLLQLKQQKRQQAYQKKLQSINITTGNFNAFTQYLWLQKHKWFYMFIGAFVTWLLIDDDSPFCYKTMGVITDPFTKKKKFMVVNQYKEKMLERRLIAILGGQVTFWTQEEMKGDNTAVNKALQKKLQAVLANLENKYGIEFKKFRKLQTNYQIAQSGDTIIASVLGQDKLIISTKLLRLSPQTIESLLLLMHSLHSRYLHIQNISFWQRMNLTSSQTDTKKIIKVEKTFISSTYSAQGVQETIELIALKYAKDEGAQKVLKESIEKAIRELFTVKRQAKTLAEFDLRSRLRNITEFIN